MKRSQKYFTGFVFLLLIALSSCNNNDEKTESIASLVTNEGKNIKWLAQWYGEGQKEDLIREIVRDFSFLNQDYNIVLEFPHEMLNINSNEPTFDKSTDSITKMVQTDIWPYDLMLCDSYMYERIANNTGDQQWGEKYLVNFINEGWFTDAHKKNMFATDAYTAIFGGIAPGTYIEGVWDINFVSSTSEEKLGIKVKEYDITIDDFIEYAKAVDSYNQSHSDKITFFSCHWEFHYAYFFNHLVMSEVGNLSDISPSDAYAALLEVYKKLEILAKYKPIEQYTVFDNDRDLKHDKVLFRLGYTWVTMFWKANNPEGEKKMRPSEFPSMPGKTARFYPGRYNAIFVVPKKARNKEMAIKLMKFMSTSDIAFKWEKYAQCPTGLNSRASFNEFGSTNFNRLSQHMGQKYNNRLEEINLQKELFNTDKNIDFRYLQIMRGEINAEQALESVKEQMSQ